MLGEQILEHEIELGNQDIFLTFLYRSCDNPPAVSLQPNHEACQQNQEIYFSETPKKNYILNNQTFLEEESFNIEDTVAVTPPQNKPCLPDGAQPTAF